MVPITLLTPSVDNMLRYPQHKHNKNTILEGGVDRRKWFLRGLWDLVGELGVGWKFVGGRA
ncbi:MAG: hypothetical protein JWO06_3523 [Bacteroidota bacterium]|nr:hypothetical protein [Bacteroidota bacterium]